MQLEVSLEQSSHAIGRAVFCGCMALAISGKQLMPGDGSEIDTATLAYLARAPYFISSNPYIAIPVLMVVLMIGATAWPTPLLRWMTWLASGGIVVLWIFSAICVAKLTAV